MAQLFKSENPSLDPQNLVSTWWVRGPAVVPAGKGVGSPTTSRLLRLAVSGRFPRVLFWVLISLGYVIHNWKKFCLWVSFLVIFLNCLYLTHKICITSGG